MVETLFVQFGEALVNISKVRALKPVRTPEEPGCLVFFDGPQDNFNPLAVGCSFHDAQRMLAETYQQMAMMQAAANRGGYSPMGGVQ